MNRLVLARGANLRLPVRIHNTSDFWLWSGFPSHPICMSYRWRRADGTVAEADGPRTLLLDAVPPGGRARVELFVAAPPEPGDYDLVVCLVQEGYAWFDQLRPELAFSRPVAVR